MAFLPQSAFRYPLPASRYPRVAGNASHRYPRAMSSELFPAGTIIDGRYRITRPLGQGGFARVFEAEHVQLERRAALKILNYVAEPGDTFYKRFVREAKIAANLDHPNVVTIFDFGVVEGKNLPYIAMEALDGRDLHEELVEYGPMTPARALPLFKGALEALGVGHDRGIVHKDLKPSNLFLVKPGTPQERLVVVDYGIARLNDDPNGQLTRTGAMSGTPAYLAPEYFQNQSVTPALDVYQMGLIIAETLTGKRVVDAATPVAIAVAHTSGQHDISDRLRASPLGPFLDKALRVDPSERFQNASEMLRALEGVRPPSPGVSFSETTQIPKAHTPEAFAETAMTPSSEFQQERSSSDEWDNTPAPRPATVQENRADATAQGRPGGDAASSGPQQSRPLAPPATHPVKQKKSKALMWAFIGFILLSGAGIVIFTVAVIMISDNEANAGYDNGSSEGAAVLDLDLDLDTDAPDAANLAYGTSKENQKLYGYAFGQSSLFTLTYSMWFYEANRVNFGGLEDGEHFGTMPDMQAVYGMANEQLRRSAGIQPSRKRLDSAAKDYIAALRRLRPILDDAAMYYEVEKGWENDGMAGGKALDKRIMPELKKYQKAERTFTIEVYKSWVAYANGLQKKYGTSGIEGARHRAAALLSAGANLMLQARRNPKSSAYTARVDDFRDALNDYRKYLSANEAKLGGQFGPVEPHTHLTTQAKSLLAAANDYPAALEDAAANVGTNKHLKKANPVLEIQTMTQAFHSMTSMHNHMLAN